MKRRTRAAGRPLIKRWEKGYGRAINVYGPTTPAALASLLLGHRCLGLLSLRGPEDILFQRVLAAEGKATGAQGHRFKAAPEGQDRRQPGRALNLQRDTSS